MKKVILNPSSSQFRGIMLLLFILMNVQVFAYDFLRDAIYYTITSGTTVKVTYGGKNYESSLYSRNVTIPDSVTYGGHTYYVTAIGEKAFYNCTNLTSINLPNSITSIGSYAFRSCTSLRTIKIPDGVVSISKRTFYNCSKLVSITIPDGVTEIGEEAFYCCSSLTSITFPDSVTSIGEYAFAGSGLKSITIPGSVKSISKYTFEFCSLVSVNILDGVTEIGEGAFYFCSNLTSINFPNSITSIGKEAFRECKSLTSITFPDSVTSIGAYAFNGCKSLTSATIGSGVTSIMSYAFYNCMNLKEINSKNPTPPNVESTDAFYNVDKQTCILNVPIDCKELYSQANGWKSFYNINEVEFPSGIENVRVDGKEVEEVGRYSLDGKNIQIPQSGINIIKYSDGSIKKVLVK